MTEVREHGFALDLPGDWEPAEASEPGAFVFRESGGDGVVTVMLLAVRPVYAIADTQRLLDDYLKHRAKYEQGQAPSLVHSEPTSWQDGDSVEGMWTGADASTGMRTRHRVVLARNVLADFRFEALEPDEVAFENRAQAVLEHAGLTAE